ncbi:protocatechuate 3,4-dioxygenase [Plantactinospora sp. WMMB334]|uniref:protocatechuate 3,4-dioxygenase n=1 Tax=Plantactinospora sp. WMMB334 TaxID=3404119 RepID=UPI003B95423F
MIGIPGTTVFRIETASTGYHLDAALHGLKDPNIRARWRADERGYLAQAGLTGEQVDAVLARDYNRLVELGSHPAYFSVLFLADGDTFAAAAAAMSGMSVPAYEAMMAAGGRFGLHWLHPAEQ